MLQGLVKYYPFRTIYYSVALVTPSWRCCGRPKVAKYGNRELHLYCDGLHVLLKCVCKRTITAGKMHKSYCNAAVAWNIHSKQETDSQYCTEYSSDVFVASERSIPAPVCLHGGDAWTRESSECSWKASEQNGEQCLFWGCYLPAGACDCRVLGRSTEKRCVVDGVQISGFQVLTSQDCSATRITLQPQILFCSSYNKNTSALF